MAMNITLVTNNDSVDFGIIACRRSTPYAQRLIDYMEDALQELEDAAGIAGDGQITVRQKQNASPRRATRRRKLKRAARAQHSAAVS
jgi:diacylglycerol O-acyltransferase